VTDLGYIAAAAFSRHAPLWLSNAVAVAAADLYTWTHPGRARALDCRLTPVAADESEARGKARETHRAFARAVRDFLAGRAEAGPRTAAPSVRLSDEAVAIFREARASGGSTVVVSGHFGPWEVALRWLAREIGPVDALAASHRSSAIENFFSELRASYGVRTLSQGRPAAAALARLRAGGWIAALADRGCGRRMRSRARAGALVPLDPAPLLLARRAQAQVLAGVAWRAPDGAVEVRFHPVFSLSPRCGGIDLPQAVARLQSFFDAHVLAHPTQWFDWGEAARPSLDRPA
jgi:lauroyl/myristoyl acyltransferase